jgi:hypothetical protein
MRFFLGVFFLGKLESYPLPFISLHFKDFHYYPSQSELLLKFYFNFKNVARWGFSISSFFTFIKTNKHNESIFNSIGSSLGKSEANRNHFEQEINNS